VLTLREPFADDLYVEAGAMQVFDVHTRAQRYIEQFGPQSIRSVRRRSRSRRSSMCSATAW
jgi:hypothetical protein